MFNSNFQKVYRKLIAQQMEGIPDIKQNIKDEFIQLELSIQYDNTCNNLFITRKNGIDFKEPTEFLRDLLMFDFSPSFSDNIQSVDMNSIYKWLLNFYSTIDNLEKTNKLRYGIIRDQNYTGIWSAFIFRKKDELEIKTNINNIPDDCGGLFIPESLLMAFSENKRRQSSLESFKKCQLVGFKNFRKLHSTKYSKIFNELNGKSSYQIWDYLCQTASYMRDDDITIIRN